MTTRLELSINKNDNANKNDTNTENLRSEKCLPNNTIRVFRSQSGFELLGSHSNHVLQSGDCLVTPDFKIDVLIVGHTNVHNESLSANNHSPFTDLQNQWQHQQANPVFDIQQTFVPTDQSKSLGFLNVTQADQQTNTSLKLPEKIKRVKQIFSE